MKLFSPLIILVVIFCTKTLQAQQPNSNLYIEYEMQDNPIPEIGPKANALLTNFIRIYGYTYSNGISKSKYLRVIKKDTSIVGRSTPRGKSLTTTYRDFTQRYQYCQHNTQLDWIVRDTLLFDRKWSISPNEKKVILGYTCMKATSNDGQTVWFCKDLPVPDGPQDYVGLPGLVLAVEASAHSIIATKIDTAVSSDPIVVPVGYRYMTTEEFNEKLNEWYAKKN